MLRSTRLWRQRMPGACLICEPQVLVRDYLKKNTVDDSLRITSKVDPGLHMCTYTCTHVQMYIHTNTHAHTHKLFTLAANTHKACSVFMSLHTLSADPFILLSHERKEVTR